MARRPLFFLMAVMLLLTVGLSALAENTMQEGSMYVNTANGKTLRFRSSKSTAADNVLAEIPYGTKVYVLDWDGTWARVRYNAAVGYVVKKHLSIARPEPFAKVQEERKQAEAVRQAEKELKQANRRLDHSRLKAVPTYDVTVITGTAGPTAALYGKTDLTSRVIGLYEEGDRLSVKAQNRDWAQVYDGGKDLIGYMLLEDLLEDLFEEEMLDDEE